jgi:hypothetical protein
MGHIKYAYVLMMLIYCGNINITKDKIESLLGANKDDAAEANAEGKPVTPAGMSLVSRDQHAGQIRNIIVSNKLYEDVDKLKCLRTTAKCKNCTYVENEKRLNSRNVPYCQNISLYILIPKDVKFQTVVVSAGRQCSYFTLRAEHRIRMLEKRVLWITFGRKREKVTREWRKWHREELYY